ncbi:hypothetical protein BGZ98_003530 [Dissophora globulifera]|nr:hypothetical protein BGZ98_003530 [Dissophora globulifera]
MAGMDSSEYQRYYMTDASTGSQGPHQQGSLNVGINSMTISEGDSHLTSGPASAAGSSSPETPTSESSANITNTGLDHWNRTREQWTKGQWHIVPSENSNNPALSAIHPGNHDAIYDSLVYDRKRLSKPIPLPLVSVGGKEMDYGRKVRYSHNQHQDQHQLHTG